MKKISLLLVLFFSFVSGLFAQIENPVKWTYTSKKTGEKTYDLHITATLEPKWHIYAQVAGEGPEPTTFSFAKNPLIKFEGSVKEEGKLVKEYDPNFKSTLMYYGNSVTFIQKIKVKSAATTVVKGEVTYMVCNDKKCLPPKSFPFTIKVATK